MFCGLWLDGGWALAFGAAAVLCPCRPFLSYGPKKRGDKLRDGQTVRQNKAEKDKFFTQWSAKVQQIYLVCHALHF